MGPFLSGGLFTLATGVEPKGEALAWGVFAGVALFGWLGTLPIRADGLESVDDGVGGDGLDGDGNDDDYANNDDPER